MTKRNLYFLLSVLVLASSLSGCGGSTPKPAGDKTTGGNSSATSSQVEKQENLDPFGKYDEPITITIGRSIDATENYPAGDTPENNQYTRHILENLNIKVETVWVAAQGKDYEQKVNLSIASNDLPDGMVVNDIQFREMVKAGQLQDMTEAFGNYASPVMKTMFEKTEGRSQKAVTFGEKMLAIPNLPVPEDGYHQMWIRKDWLDKLNLPVPTTVDELEKVAKAFVQQDPDGNKLDDTIGISGPQNGGKLYANFLESTNNTFGLDPIFSAFNAYPGYWLEDQNGKAVYGSILPETKTALAKLQDFYAQGLIDREMGVRKDASEPVISGKTGIFFGPWWMGYWPLPDAIKNDPEANWQAYALPLDANGQYSPHMGAVATQYTVVKKGYPYPQAVVKMLNLLIRDESTFNLDHGGIGNYPLRVPMAALDECEITVQALTDVLNGTKKPEDFDDPVYDMYKLLRNDVRSIQKVKLAPFDKMDITYWNPQGDMSSFSRMYSIMVGTSSLYEAPMNKIYSLSYSQTKTMERRWVNLKKLEDETFLKIIMGASPLDSFDQFVQDWKTQGGDEITAEVEETAKQ